MKCEETEKSVRGNLGGRKRPHTGALASAQCVCPSVPVNHCMEMVPPAAGLRTLSAGFLVTVYDSSSGALGVWLTRMRDVPDLDDGTVWDPRLPSARVGVSQLQPAGPRRHRWFICDRASYQGGLVAFLITVGTSELLLKNHELQDRQSGERSGLGCTVPGAVPLPLGLVYPSFQVSERRAVF